MLIEIKNKIAELSDQWMMFLCYGYSCDPKASETIKKLELYKDVLEQHEKALRLGIKPCLTPEAFQCLKEKLIPLIGIQKCTYSDIETNDSSRSIWELKNPYCVSHEIWDKWARITARDLNISLNIEKESNSLVLEIAKKIIPCDVILAINAVKEANNLNLTISRTKKESKIDFELLLKKTKANLDLNTYLKLIDCNISFDVIKEVYNNNLELEVSSIRGNDEVFLKTNLSKYNITDVNLDLKMIKRKFNYEPTKKKKDFLTDYC